MVAAPKNVILCLKNQWEVADTEQYKNVHRDIELSHIAMAASKRLVSSFGEGRRASWLFVNVPTRN